MIWDCKQESTIVSALRFIADTQKGVRKLIPVWGSADAFPNAHKVETFVLPYNMAVNAVSHRFLQSADQYNYPLPLNIIGSFQASLKTN